MNKTEWNQIIRSFPNPSLLQTWEWGEIKAQYGWKVDHKVWNDGKGNAQAAALILKKEQKIPVLGGKLKILYIPKGPLLDWQSDIRETVLHDLVAYAHKEEAIYLKIDPEIVTARGYEGQANFTPYPEAAEIIQGMQVEGWVISGQQIQFKNTFWINLEESEEKLLENMKQKTRYNIRLAEKKGVGVRIAFINELEQFYELYAETSNRDDFIIRPKEYYMALWKTFISNDMATPLLAEVDGEVVAGLMLFHFGGHSWYLYGMSSSQHREKMPNYLLQWEAIKLSKSYGCKIYDLWGAPDVFDTTDRMWGVHKFKEGLGGRVIQTIGALDYPTSKFKYKIVQEVLPRILAITRSIRRRQIKDELAG